MTADLRASYDAFPYQSLPLRQTHPDRLATIASLFGFAPAPVEQCRVLEIGCAAGGNLIPMAVSYPQSGFVGIDFSAVQIAEGAREVDALKLTNIQLLPLDVMAFDESWGSFDYIIAHGIYSWVPGAVQEKILALCARHLTASGVAMISYNTLPGWRMLAVVRDAMLFQTRGIDDPRLRVAQARATLEFLAASVQGDESAYARLIRLAAENLRHKPDYYILHEYLEDTNEPLYFHEFMSRAGRHGLRYLGDTDLRTMLSTGIAPAAEETLNRIATDLLRREQFLDFLRNRTFRHTLLLRAGAVLDRKLAPARIMPLRVSLAAAGEPSTGLSMADAQGRARAINAAAGAGPMAAAALDVLAAQAPLAVAFDALFEQAARAAKPAPPDIGMERTRLASLVLQWHLADAVELHFAASSFVVEPGMRPMASPHARRQAAIGAQVTNQRHEVVTVDDSARALLRELDGGRTAEEAAAAAWPELSRDARSARLNKTLTMLARQALLIA